jgi:hypothetical protein
MTNAIASRWIILSFPVLLSSLACPSVVVQAAVRNVSLCDVARNTERYDNQEITVTAQYESDGVEREILSDAACKESGFALEILRDTKGKNELRVALHGGYPGTLDKTVVGTFTGVFHWVPDGHPPRVLRVRSMKDFSAHQKALPFKVPE